MRQRATQKLKTNMQDLGRHSKLVHSVAKLFSIISFESQLVSCLVVSDALQLVFESSLTQCSDIAFVWTETIATRIVVCGLRFYQVSATFTSPYICLTSLLSGLQKFLEAIHPPLAIRTFHHRSKVFNGPIRENTLPAPPLMKVRSDHTLFGLNSK